MRDWSGGEAPDSGAEDPIGAGEWERRVIDALRVFKNGGVHPIATICSTETFAPGGYSFGQKEMPPHIYIEKYELDENEAQDFAEFWKRASHPRVLKGRNFLTLAIRRFSQAGARASSEDKIIDLMICAEALFLTQLGKVEGELRYRLAQRAAFFTEQDPVKRIAAYKFMRSAYDVRSQIVHGTDKPLELPKRLDGVPYSLSEFCGEAEECLRKALKNAIMLAQQPHAPKYLVDWDSLIFQTS